MTSEQQTFGSGILELFRDEEGELIRVQETDVDSSVIASYAVEGHILRKSTNRDGKDKRSVIRFAEDIALRLMFMDGRYTVNACARGGVARHPRVVHGGESVDGLITHCQLESDVVENMLSKLAIYESDHEARDQKQNTEVSE